MSRVDGEAGDELSLALSAAAHPIRRDMLARLAKSPLNVGELSGGYAISWPAVSRHLKTLERAGLVERTIHGRSHVIALRSEGLRRIADWSAAQSAEWNDRLARLKALMEEEMAELLLARAMASTSIKAPPEKIFDAWLNPDLAARFMAAGSTHVESINIDAREGGAFRIGMKDETIHDHHGNYVLIDRPRRLVFTWVSKGTEGRLTMVEVRFTPEGDGTRVELRHDGLLNEERERQHATGWGTILDKLAALFA